MKPLKLFSFLYFNLVLGSQAYGTCNEFLSLSREQQTTMIQQMREAKDQKLVTPRLRTKAEVETPDLSKPVQLELPNGQIKWTAGLSGQQILMLDDLAELEGPELLKPIPIRLLNKNGYGYGEEIDPLTGQQMDYSASSAVWDIFVMKTYVNGRQKILIYAGGMADDPVTGKPLLIAHNNTRQRLVFDGEFVEIRPGEYTILGTNPRPLHYQNTPKNGEWITPTFRHGYGGEVVLLENGEPYIAPNGRPQLVKEEVVAMMGNQFRTAIVMADLSDDLTQVIGPSRIIMDVFKPDGSVYKAAQRIGLGPLVEGGRVTIMHNDRPIGSQKELFELRRRGVNIKVEMDFSAGEYYGAYGAYVAFASEKDFNFKPMVDKNGELIDLMEPLRPLFTWLGRPMRYYLGSRIKLQGHGVPRISIPEEIPVDVPPGANISLFKRQLIDFELESFYLGGKKYYRMKDELKVFQ